MNVFAAGFLFLLLGGSPQDATGDFFPDGALRVDLQLVGNAKQELVCIDVLRKEPFFSGPARAEEPFERGMHRCSLYDAASGRLLFRRGFCTLFGEWRTTGQAKGDAVRVFSHTLLFPLPRKNCILAVSVREKTRTFKEVLRQELDLEEQALNDETFPFDFETVRLAYHGNPEGKLDIVILGDGYTKGEMDSFEAAARRAMKEILSASPFKENEDRINFWAVKSPSPEAGVDEPSQGVFRSTLFDTSFGTFGIERYALSLNVKRIRDAAACAPYDFILLLFNSPRYGGGGIYRLFAVASGGAYAPGIVVHEMGHCIAGLADEYVDASVSYEDIYPEGVEPWEPNLTALLDPAHPKWASFLAPDTPIPTPDAPELRRQTGCFEGAGYKAEGLFRPAYDCTMRSLQSPFCPVCREAILDVIRFYAP